jgi:hypothetical protein
MKQLALVLLLCGCGIFAQAQYRPGPPPPPNDPWNYSGGQPGNWDRSWNNRPFPKRGACFFIDSHFRGNRFCVRSGDRLPGLPGGFGDQISSIQTFGGATVQVFVDHRFGGGSARMGTTVDLSRVRGPKGASWNDRISSLVVF